MFQPYSAPAEGAALQQNLQVGFYQWYNPTILKHYYSIDRNDPFPISNGYIFERRIGVVFDGPG
jgi:hypothetical protein